MTEFFPLQSGEEKVPRFLLFAGSMNLFSLIFVFKLSKIILHNQECQVPSRKRRKSFWGDGWAGTKIFWTVRTGTKFLKDNKTYRIKKILKGTNIFTTGRDVTRWDRTERDERGRGGTKIFETKRVEHNSWDGRNGT